MPGSNQGKAWGQVDRVAGEIALDLLKGLVARGQGFDPSKGAGQTKLTLKRFGV